MFSRFTDGARRVVVQAQEAAINLNHRHIGAEHILLALVQEGEGVATNALKALGLSHDAVRTEVAEIIAPGPERPSGHIPFTPASKIVLKQSLQEALRLGHDKIGSEHILLGLTHIPDDDTAAKALVRLGISLDTIRQRTLALMAEGQG